MSKKILIIEDNAKLSEEAAVQQAEKVLTARWLCHYM